MEKLRDVYRLYTEDAEGNLVLANDVHHGQAVSAIRELDLVLSPFRSWLDGKIS